MMYDKNWWTTQITSDKCNYGCCVIDYDVVVERDCKKEEKEMRVEDYEKRIIRQNESESKYFIFCELFGADDDEFDCEQVFVYDKQNNKFINIDAAVEVLFSCEIEGVVLNKNYHLIQNRPSESKKKNTWCIDSQKYLKMINVEMTDEDFIEEIIKNFSRIIYLDGGSDCEEEDGDVFVYIDENNIKMLFINKAYM